MKRIFAPLLATALAAVPAAADAQMVGSRVMQAYNDASVDYNSALNMFIASTEQPFDNTPVRIACGGDDRYNVTVPTDALIGELKDQIRNVQGEAKQPGANAYPPSREWTTKWKAVADQFAATEQTASGSRQAVLDSMGQLLAGMDDAARQLGTWTQRLATFIESVRSQTSSLRVSLARARDQATRWADETRRRSMEWKCRDGLEPRLASFERIFRSEMDVVERAFTPVERYGRSLTEATAGVLGGVVSSRTAIAGIRDRVATLGGDQASGFMLTLRLRTSANAWRALADGASDQRP